MDQLVTEILKLVSTPPPIEAPTFNGEGHVELFIRQFRDIAEENGWTEKATLLHLRSSLEGKARVYGRSDTTREIFASLQTRYGVSAPQAKQRLLGLKRDSRESVLDFAMEIKRLVDIAYPSWHVDSREKFAVDQLVQSMDSIPLRRHLLLVDTSTVTSTALAIERYLSVEGANK